MRKRKRTKNNGDAKSKIETHQCLRENIQHPPKMAKFELRRLAYPLFLITHRKEEPPEAAKRLELQTLGVMGICTCT
jgi:hypothetical protein